MSDAIEDAVRKAVAESVAESVAKVAPTAVSALVEAFGGASVKEQAALLTALASSLRRSCGSEGAAWIFQSDWVSAELDDDTRDVLQHFAGLG